MLERIQSILTIFFIVAALAFTGCTSDEETDGCNELDYGGSFLMIDELTFCPAYLSIDKIQNYNHQYLEQKLVSNFTTDYETTAMNGRAIDVQIVIRTPYPNPDTLELPNEFSGSYEELQSMGYTMDIILEERTVKPVFYEINIDSLPGLLDVYFKLHNQDEFIAISLDGEVLLGEDHKQVPWKSDFGFME